MGEPRGAETPASGAVEMTVAEFLGLDEVEVRLVELRVAIAVEIRRRREESGMSQAALADTMGVKQPRIPSIEAAVGVSLDTMLKAFFACGGSLLDLAAVATEAADRADRQRPRT